MYPMAGADYSYKLQLNYVALYTIMITISWMLKQHLQLQLPKNTYNYNYSKSTITIIQKSYNYNYKSGSHFYCSQHTNNS